MWIDWIAAAYAEKLAPDASSVARIALPLIIAETYEKFVLDVPIEVYYDAKGERHVIGKDGAEAQS